MVLCKLRTLEGYVLTVKQKAHKREYLRGWRAVNREHVRVRDRATYARNREVIQARSRLAMAKKRADNPEKAFMYRKQVGLKQYGLSIIDYEAMIEAQGGRCAICGTDDPGGGVRNGRKKGWCVDHCHTTGTVRQLLCNACNPGLGFFKHDIALLQKAIHYLST